VSVAVTESTVSTRIRTDSASEAISVSATSDSNYVFNVQSAASIAATTTGAANGIFAMPGETQAAITVSCEAKRLGEEWGVVAPGTEVWTDIPVGSEIWTIQSVGTEVWALQ
jgi:hypothetical protein